EQGEVRRLQPPRFIRRADHITRDRSPHKPLPLIVDMAKASGSRVDQVVVDVLDLLTHFGQKLRRSDSVGDTMIEAEHHAGDSPKSYSSARQGIGLVERVAHEKRADGRGRDY